MSLAVRIEIKTPIPSKKDALMPRKRGARGKGMIYRPETKALIDAVTSYCRIAWGPRPVIVHPRIEIFFYVTNASQDRDGILTTVLDCLKVARVIHDDCVRWFNGTLVIHPAEIVPTVRMARTVLLISETETEASAHGTNHNAAGSRQKKTAG